MLQRKLGSTGKTAAVIGMGGMRFDLSAPVEDSARLIRHAWERGVTYFDTAPGYERSEAAFGLALREMLRQRRDRPFFVATKSYKSDPAEIRRDLEASLERLGLDAIDFYFVWCTLTFEEFRQRERSGAIREFERLKDEGLIRHVCLSTHANGHEIRETLAAYPFEAVLLGYSAMNFAYRQDGIQAAAESGAAVVVMNPLGGGLIPQHPQIFDFLRTRPDESLVEGALRFLIHDPRIAVALVGMATPAHVDEAVRAAEGFRPLDPATVDAVKGRLRQSFDRMCTACGYCDQCPVNIPIPKVMDAANVLDLTASPQQAADRLKWHWGLADDASVVDSCTDCGLCDSLCTQKLPIRERMRQLKERIAKSRSPG